MKTLVSLAAIVIIVWGFLSFGANGWHHDIGHGEHTGYVTAIEKSGLIYKTATAYIKTDVSSSQEDSYCVLGDDVYAKLQDASVNKTKVTVFYQEYITYGWKYCDGEQAAIVGVK